MKKVLLVILAVVMITCLFVSCAKNNETSVINISMPDGAPALAMAKLMKDFTYENYVVNFEIVPGVNEITARLSQKTANIAMLPTNIATKLYANNLDIRLISSNVFGVLYLVGTEEITSLNQLKGQTIQCIGQGGTPEFMLKFILETNSISLDEVDIQYQSDGSSIIPLLKTGSAKFALLGEPAATMSTEKAGTKILFNLQDEWKKLTGFDGYPQASTIATVDTITNHSGFLKAFNKAMLENKEWIKENSADVNSILKEYGSAVTFANNTVIANCNIDFVSATDAKDSITVYLETMQSYNPAFIGGIPDDAFYQIIE
ncbi:MAG TPA: ABC transporter substrate-binding protein [Clostridia bacterium]|nr:ABC transporter substrate-binding protein [Clostridia bacterium]